jgi:hypothetical protein
MLCFALISSAAIYVGAQGCGGGEGIVPPTDTGDTDGSASVDGTGGGGDPDTGGFGNTDGASDNDARNNDSSSGGNDSSSGNDTGTDAGSIPDVSFFYDAPVRDSALSQDSACAQTTAQAQLTPLDMFVMLDRSGSMDPDCNIGDTTASRWCRAINALSTYFNSASATGNAAALQYFPNGGACNGTGYDVAAVPAGNGYLALPTNGFNTSLNNTNPNGSNTPIEGAIRGITQFTARAVNRRAGRTTIGILITDGSPNGCVTSATSLRDILQTHFNATGLRTFVIGMTGASFSTLETIATGGNAPLHNDNVNGINDTCGNGAGPCRHWNVGDGNGNVFVEALKAIQAAAVGCSMQMPTTDAGVVNPNNVQVEYSPNGQPPAQGLVRVNDAAACVNNGWYYDNNTSPTTINLCPTICNTVQADPGAKVNVLLGCLGG